MTNKNIFTFLIYLNFIYLVTTQDVIEFVAPKLNTINTIKLNESISEGALIYTLIAKGGTPPLLFTIQPKGFKAELKRVDDHSAGVILNQKLEAKDTYSFRCRVKDSMGVESSQTPTVHLDVLDVNDNPPYFEPYQSIYQINESYFPPNNLLFSLNAIDSADFYEFGTLGIVFEFDLKDDKNKHLFRAEQRSSSTEAIFELYLEKEFDFEHTVMHRITVTAFDNKKQPDYLSASVIIVINVNDIDDNGPVFTKLPSFKKLDENTKKDTSVFVITAVDGDRDVNDRIEYSITNGNERNAFRIDKDTGEVFVEEPLDREELKDDVEIILEITAQEVNDGHQSTASANCTIVIQDVNDEAPDFHPDFYNGIIAENSFINTAVDIGGYITVIDKDQSQNAAFTVTLTTYDDLFYLKPPSGVNEGFFSLLVKNKSDLDFEKYGPEPLVVKMKSVDKKDPFFTRVASINVTITDENDLFPIFNQTSYDASVMENSPKGKFVLTVSAEDGDTGVYGTYGIRYSIDGNVPFKVDRITGVLTVDSNIDREQIDEYSFTIYARDNDGSGNSNSVGVVIKILDENDNVPQFTATNYKALLQENEARFQIPLYLQATDKDFEDNGKVFYNITDVNTVAGNLNIDYFDLKEDQGRVELTVSDPLKMDYEKLCKNIQINCTISVTVEAFDGGIPVKSNSTTIEVTLMDVNDEIPQFSEPKKIDVPLKENDRNGAFVARVSAVDGDVTDRFKQISYQITDGATDLFIINPTTGEVTVGKKANLDLGDRFETNSFELSVVATDRIYREDNDFFIINVTVHDVNNKQPFFTGSNMANILENASWTQELKYELRAEDYDSDFLFEYSFGSIKGFKPDKREFMNESYVRDLFEVEADSGVIRVKSELDRETVEKVVITLVVNDANTVEGVSSATESLTVLIGDVNDNAPWFGAEKYEGVVTEHVDLGTEIRPVVTAIDVDLDQNVVFSLSGDEDFVKLVGISNDGLLTVISDIDRENHSSIIVTIHATDDGHPEMSNSTTYNITVLDINDNKPVFSSPNYHVTISEATKINESILIVNATDADEGDFAKIHFDFDQSKGQANFKMDDETGEIFVASELDRDTGSNILIFGVLARDNVKNPLKSLTSTATVTVTLLDVNDNAPVIDAVKDCVNVFENVEDANKLPYDLPFTIYGSDPDYKQNGSIEFYLADNNTKAVKELFDIHPTPNDDKTAKLYVKKSLDNLVGQFQIIVNARDKGTPVQHAKTVEEIKVCVQDVNNNKPVIHFPTPTEKISCFENLKVKKVVFEINATDDDVDYDNKRLSYTIKSFDDTFEADRDGKVILIKKLDRSEKKWYEINFEVCDHGKPAALCTPGVCHLIVRSVDDKPPEFREFREQELEFTEEMEPGVESREIHEAVDDARDLSGLPDNVVKEEEKILSDICYYVVGGSTNTFDLNRRSRQLQTRNILDYETKTNYDIYIEATFDCQTPPPALGADVDLTNLPKSILTIKIKVIDVNDHPPKFTQKIFGGGIENSASPGRILQLNATDVDVGPNAEVRYFIDSDIVVVQGENIDADKNKNVWFKLNEEDGEISSYYQFSEDMKGYIHFEVRVNNSKELVKSKSNMTFDTAAVKIFVLRNDQKSTFIIRRSKEEFWLLREGFAKKLSNLTGTIAHISSVVVYVDRDTSVTRPEWCLASVYYINENNDVIDPSTVEESLDSNYQAQSQLANEFAVHEVHKQIAPKEKEVDPMSTAIYAIGGALILLLTAFLSLYCSRVSKLKLQLKASSVSTYSDMNRKKSLGPEMPTTNIHAKPASNPIYNFEDCDVRLKESSDAVSVASEGSLVNDSNDFEGGENNRGFVGRLENMFAVENEENQSPPSYEQTEQINDNFILKRSDSVEAMML